MGHEISQFDIPNRQLLAGSAQACIWSDIGKAKITRSIFGKPKVRVIREKDKILRAWLLAALAAAALAVAGWQGWTAYKQNKLLAAIPPLSERIIVSPPIYQPETIAPAATRSSGKSKPESLIQSEIDSLVASPPQRPPAAAKPAAEKPFTAQSLLSSKPVPPATNNGSSLNQTSTQPYTKQSATIQPAAPAVAAPLVAHPVTAASTPSATTPAAGKPAPVASPDKPSSKKDSPAPSPAGSSQPSGSSVQPQASVQPQVNGQTQANDQTQVNARGTAIIFVQPDNTKP